MAKHQNPYQDVDLVDIVFPSFLGNEEHLFKEEECTGVLRSQDVKGAFQHQLPIGGQVRTLPVYQKRLYLLQIQMKAHPHTISAGFPHHENVCQPGASLYL